MLNQLSEGVREFATIGIIIALVIILGACQINETRITASEGATVEVLSEQDRGGNTVETANEADVGLN